MMTADEEECCEGLNIDRLVQIRRLSGWQTEAAAATTMITITTWWAIKTCHLIFVH